MSTITEALFNANRFASTQTNLDGDDFIYTDIVTSGWIGGADEDYVLQVGDSAIALSSVLLQSDKTFNFKLFEGTVFTQGTGDAIIPFRLNRTKVGRPLSLIDAEKNPIISNLGNLIWEKNFLILSTTLFNGFGSALLPLGIIMKPQTSYTLQMSNTGDAVPGLLEFDLRFTTLFPKQGPLATPTLLPASI